MCCPVFAVCGVVLLWKGKRERHLNEDERENGQPTGKVATNESSRIGRWKRRKKKGEKAVKKQNVATTSPGALSLLLLLRCVHLSVVFSALLVSFSDGGAPVSWSGEHGIVKRDGFRSLVISLRVLYPTRRA